MSPELIVASVGGLIILLTLIIFIRRKLPSKIKSVHYIKKWREIQKMCANKEDWAHAIVHADMLLEEVLRKKKLAGKTTGEMMVNAQSKFSANDSVWIAHKLANSIRQDGDKPMQESEVKDALIAFRQALRDLGAL